MAVPPLAVGDEGGFREDVLGEHAGAPAGVRDDDVGAVAVAPRRERRPHEGLGAQRGAVHRLGVGVGLGRRRAVRRVAQQARPVRPGVARRRGEGHLPAAAGQPVAEGAELRRVVVVDEEDARGPRAPVGQSGRPHRDEPERQRTDAGGERDPEDEPEAGRATVAAAAPRRRASPRSAPARPRGAGSRRAGPRGPAASPAAARPATGVTASKIRSTRRRSGSAAAAGPARRSSQLRRRRLARRRRDGELEAGLQRRLELAGEAVAAGPDAAALEVLAEPVGAHRRAQGALAADVDLERGLAVGAVDRPAGDAVGAEHVDDAVEARPDRRCRDGRGRDRAVRAQSTWRSPTGRVIDLVRPKLNEVPTASTAPRSELRRIAYSRFPLVRLAVAFALAAAASPAWAEEAPRVSARRRRSSTGRPRRCADWDIPDTPARAWRGRDGTVHALPERSEAGRAPARASAQLARDCTVLYRGAGADDPAAYDDRAWIHATYADGARVIALAHVEYHGHLRPRPLPDRWLRPVLAQRHRRAALRRRRPQLRARGRRCVAALPYRYSGEAGRRERLLQSEQHPAPRRLSLRLRHGRAYRRAAPRALPAAPADRRRTGGLARLGRRRLHRPLRRPLPRGRGRPGAPRLRAGRGICSTVSSVVESAATGRYLAVTAATRTGPDGVARSGIYWTISPDLLALEPSRRCSGRRRCSGGATAPRRRPTPIPSLLDADSPSRELRDGRRRLLALSRRDAARPGLRGRARARPDPAAGQLARAMSVRRERRRQRRRVAEAGNDVAALDRARPPRRRPAPRSRRAPRRSSPSAPRTGRRSSSATIGAQAAARRSPRGSAAAARGRASRRRSP